MNRRQFIESQGATCKNWTWSWSFVNHAEKVVIFGAWDINTAGNTALIFSEAWRTNRRGHKPHAVKESREHLRLIEEEGYILKTFPMIFSRADQDQNGIGPAKIAAFTPKLSRKNLCRVGTNWYATDDASSVQVPEGEYRGSKEYALVYAELIMAARYRGTVTYQELAKLIGLPLKGNYMGQVLGKLLGEISADEVANGRPMLSVIAVSVDGKPRKGFYPWAVKLGRFEGKEELKRAFLETEKKAVYDAWKVILRD